MAKVKDKKVEEIVDTTEQRKKQIEEAVKKVKLTKIFNVDRKIHFHAGDCKISLNKCTVSSYNWFYNRRFNRSIKRYITNTRL